MNFASLDDIEALALSRMDRNTRHYYESGAIDEKTMAANRADFDRFLLRPRVLRNVSNIDLSTTVLSCRVAWPVAFAPSAMHGLAHPDAELGSAAAAKNTNTLMTLSSYSTTTLEDVIAAPSKNIRETPFWLQLYVHTDRTISETLLKRAEAAGYKALALTVDAPVLGRRLNDLRFKFAMPKHLKLKNFAPEQGVMTASERNANPDASRSQKGSKADAALTWRDIAWLRGVTTMKIVLKGIMTPEDAILACEYGVDGIIVSNHGGRQLDSSPSSISVLEEIVAVVDSFPGNGKAKPEVYMDGGIRRGTDVVKALALGAKVVFIGRPVLYGLAVGGSAGVEAVVSVLTEEIKVAMALCGVTNIEQLRREKCVVKRKFKGLENFKL
ncbi:hypothetical protein HK100_001151 [Physocladia obscura]|uniref:Oxidase FUB9 n=1 Tax=Physocladia obscura TaxID=109957 RepID=A0AAD5SYB2_9FUNG|nr:hypothetical protein HK100_001151 [Physocladia obscura]